MKDDGIREPDNKEEERANGRSFTGNYFSSPGDGLDIMARTNYSTNLSDAIDLIGHMGTNGDGYILLDEWGWTVTDVKFTTHHDYYDGAMPEREEEAAGDWKLSEADESPGRVVDGADLGSTIRNQA